MCHKCYDYEKFIMGTPEAAFKSLSLARTRLVRFLEAVKEIKSGRLLEIGCGTGGFIRAVQSHRKEFEYHGCDLSNFYIQTAKENSNGKISYLVSSVESLPYKSDSFDIVVAIDLLEHIESVNDALGEVYRILKPGGIFHAYVPCEGNWYTPYYWLDAHRLTRKHVGHVQKFSTKSLYTLLEKGHFKIIRKRYSKHYFGQCLTFFSLYVVKELLLNFFGRRVIDSCRDNFAFVDNGGNNNGLAPDTSGLLRKLKDVWVSINRPFAALAFFESEILKKYPLGVGVSVSCVKSDSYAE